MNKHLRKGLLYVGVAGAAGLAGLYFVRPQIGHPPITGDIAAPAEVESVLRRACYDCHSNETHLAWFDHIGPAPWIVSRDVRAGRAAMNFSHWDRLNDAQRSGKLFEALNQMQFGAMPPPSYASLHPEAKISDQDLAALRNYLVALTPALAANTAGAASTSSASSTQVTAATLESSSPKAPTDAKRDVAPSPNGIGYQPDYKNWETISVSDRVDLGQTRVILGNDVAVKAIADKRTNPWPDGTAFAKVAWSQVTDAEGNVHTGDFKTVGFMIKDARQYASTSGWGFARWHGEELKPFGQDASFAGTECLNCHKPMEKYDFVFTAPFNLAKKQP
ncbi:heme-binding domain-containing protein [Pendulispora albinea]|uniref:Heme-binding domain-containing protein n=1 Tax=Pendulispora albinea TaxID=2741071 RepID=A0ABZ2M0N7_9BACT